MVERGREASFNQINQPINRDSSIARLIYHVPGHQELKPQPARLALYFICFEVFKLKISFISQNTTM